MTTTRQFWHSPHNCDTLSHFRRMNLQQYYNTICIRQCCHPAPQPWSAGSRVTIFPTWSAAYGVATYSTTHSALSEKVWTALPPVSWSEIWSCRTLRSDPQSVNAWRQNTDHLHLNLECIHPDELGKWNVITTSGGAVQRPMTNQTGMECVRNVHAPDRMGMSSWSLISLPHWHLWWQLWVALCMSGQILHWEWEDVQHIIHAMGVLQGCACQLKIEP